MAPESNLDHVFVDMPNKMLFLTIDKKYTGSYQNGILSAGIAWQIGAAKAGRICKGTEVYDTGKPPKSRLCRNA